MRSIMFRLTALTLSVFAAACTIGRTEAPPLTGPSELAMSLTLTASPDTLVQDGAIHITFGNRANNSIKGKILSLRPAVVSDAPIVPVAWVCGNATAPEKMTVKGVNRTDIPFTYLPFKCR